MKKSYNETWVENINNQEIIDDWFFRKLISDEQRKEAHQVFPVGFHQSNIFVKTGLFLFTFLMASAGLGFAALFLFDIFSESRFSFSAISLIYAFLFLYFLEYFIKNKNFYRSGVDNALLYSLLFAAFSAIVGFTNFNLPNWIYCIIALVILLPTTLRYADPIVAFVAYLTWLAFWFFLITKYPIGKIIIPFVIMVISAMSYFLVEYWKKKEAGSYYTETQNIIKILALTTFYFGGNYLIVREGNALLNDLENSIQINFAPLFYIFSTVIPLFYIVYGLKKHDRKFLLVGIGAAAFSIFTYQHYFSVLPLEWVLTITGLFLVGLCIWAIRTLKTTKFGLTSEAVGTNEYKNLEAFIVNQAMQQPHQPNKTDFGKGDFGGGGAGSGY
ncbi:MAG: MgtC/SapB family protein [Emticicia sp.]